MWTVEVGVECLNRQQQRAAEESPTALASSPNLDIILGKIQRKCCLRSTCRRKNQTEEFGRLSWAAWLRMCKQSKVKHRATMGQEEPSLICCFTYVRPQTSLGDCVVKLCTEID